MDAKALFQSLVDSERPALESLFELFDGLDPIDTPFMLGEWEGGSFRTGHPGEQQLAALGWAGKIFRGDDDVDPIVVRDPAGARTSSPIMGAATLRHVRYRGVSTATMVYDRHPIFDHFRKLDDDLVLGVMDRKGDAFPLFFYLRRMSRPEAAR